MIVKSHQRQLLAFFAVAAVFTVLGALLFSAGLDERDRHHSELQTKRLQLQKYKSLLAAEDEVLRRIEELKSHPAVTTWIFNEETEPLAAAAMQAALKGLVVKAGAAAQSIQSLDSSSVESLHRIGARVSFEASNQQLLSLLDLMANHEPRLFVDKVAIRATRRFVLGEKMVQEPQLNIQLQVYGFNRELGNESG